MSKISIKGNASGTGVFSIEAPNSNSDRSLVLPDAAGTLVNDATLNTAFNVSGSAPKYACRAWVNFNGTGTVAIRASGNVSSITDNGTGNYTVNFTTAMPDTNYAVAGWASNNDDAGGENFAVSGNVSDTYATSAVTIRTVENSGSGTVTTDSPKISLIVCR